MAVTLSPQPAGSVETGKFVPQACGSELFLQALRGRLGTACSALVTAQVPGAGFEPQVIVAPPLPLAPPVPVVPPLLAPPVPVAPPPLAPPSPVVPPLPVTPPLPVVPPLPVA